MKRVFLKVFDDLDNSVEAASSHTLRLDDLEVDLDLGDDNYLRLREALDPFLMAGTPTAAEPRLAEPAGISTREFNKRMRAWGNANGFPVREPALGEKKTYYHPKGLHDAYIRHLEEEAARQSA
jgi:hypothetical protein